MFEFLARILVHYRLRSFAFIVRQKSVRCTQDGGRKASTSAPEDDADPNEHADHADEKDQYE